MTGYVVIQRNPHSGTRRRSHHILALIQGLKAAGLTPRLFSHRARLDAFIASHQANSTIRAMVAAGGDGTVDDLLNRHPEIPLAILPLGTENLLAKYLGFQRNGAWLAPRIAVGRLRRMDLARANGRLFCTVASVGFDASIVHHVHANRAGHASRWSYFFAFLRHLVSYRLTPLTVTVTTPAGTSTHHATQVFVSNVPKYAMQLPIGRGGDEADGLLEVQMMDLPHIPALLWAIAWLFLGRNSGIRQQATDVRITTRTPRPPGAPPLAEVAVEVDGDPAGTTPVHMTISPRALTIIDTRPPDQHTTEPLPLRVQSPMPNPVPNPVLARDLSHAPPAHSLSLSQPPL
ncbi:MAG: diacylglycerol kinase family protein [Phycisphaerales bacterium]